MFGQITSIDDLFLPEKADESEANLTTAELRDLLDDSVQIGSFQKYFTIDNLNKSTTLQDERDFNNINFKMLDFTRKRTRVTYYNREKKTFDNNNFDKFDFKGQFNFERKKLAITQNIGLQFLLHSR